MNNFKNTFSVLLLGVTLSGVSYSQNDEVLVGEAFFSQIDEADNIDSLAIWKDSNTDEVTLYATAKGTHRLAVSDAENGFPLPYMGTKGVEAGQYNRPNGIAVAGDFLFVVERDNRRVQVTDLSREVTLGFFGLDSLIKPYGLYIQSLDSGTFRVFVTDDYALVPEVDEPLREGGAKGRIKQFIVGIDKGSMNAKLEKTFGADVGESTLHVVESISGDPFYDRLLIADEDPVNGMSIKVFDMKGAFTGESLGDGIFKYQPEGIALWETGEKSGIWICADQGKAKTIYRLFDRETLEYRGSFVGKYTSNTDGICLYPYSIGKYSMGLFYAVHDDSGVGAWSLKDIVEAIALEKN
ncbi:hypothetical protein MLD52_13830 [Puniceicoccaceae bacterium K14]|nr:hypothetical protein [Puniceicoccaceae bacterium K14]